MAQVTLSTEFALRKWVKSLTSVVTQSGVCSSFVEIENEVHDEECLAWLERTMAWVASSGGVDGFDGVEWWLRRRRWRCWWFGGVDGVDGWRRWWTRVFDTEGTDVEVPLCPAQQ